MGCWNQTCMISGLPIHWSEPVVSIFLAGKDTNQRADHCYAHAFWDPIPYVLYGKYNDYGAVEDFEPTNQTELLRYFADHLLEMEQGENEYHDHPTSVAELSLEKIYEWDHSHRLFFKWSHLGEKRGERRPVDHIQIKRSLFDRIIETVKIQEYESSGYRYVTFKDLMHNIDGAVDWLQKKLTIEEGAYGDPVNDLRRLIESTWKNVDLPPQVAWLRKGDWHDYEDPWAEMFVNADHEHAKQMMIERIKFTLFEYWMSEARKTWYVPGHVGSQDGDTAPHRMLAKWMIEDCDARDAEYGEEEDEEEPEEILGAA